MVPVPACCGCRGEVQELADFCPGVLLIAGLADGGGDNLLGLGDEAGQGVQCDGAVTEPVRGAQRGEGVDGLGEDGGAVGVDAGGGQFAGPGEPRSLAGQAASSRWRCRVGRNSMVVWKKVQDSQMDSK